MDAGEFMHFVSFQGWAKKERGEERERERGREGGREGEGEEVTREGIKACPREHQPPKETNEEIVLSKRESSTFAYTGLHRAAPATGRGLATANRHPFVACTRASQRAP